MLAAAHLSVDGVLFLKRLLGIESLPVVLALLDNVYYAADQAVVDDHTVPVLVDNGLLSPDGTVEPSLHKWLWVLERPEVDVSLRAVEGDRMRRAVVARRGDDHVLALRRNDEVVIQGVWSHGQSVDEVMCAPLWAALRVSRDELAPPPADLESVTLPWAEVQELAMCPPGQNLRWLRDHGVNHAAAKILNEMSTYSGQRAELVNHQDQGIITFETPAGVGVADTSAGRVVSAVRRQGSQLYVTFGPGTYARFRAAMTDLVELTPAKNWFAARPRPN
ncbi:ESX-1 secretion-associated protein EspG1 [Mycobacterium simulans]|uniref:ESX secretion-associated protein EspG n=1 Tax=Mycobacterium simulans TaxID=627089 RepID=UPI00174BFE49|nr:ESX secretion-associated protein EspG [Mycobacterium simulans]SON61869.1 ESX-1 secretion-associated protein EspG1 [Mycobacterium simulans]